MRSDLLISIHNPNLHTSNVDQAIKSVLVQETDLPFEVNLVGMRKISLVEKNPKVKFILKKQPVEAARTLIIGIYDAQ